MEDVKEKSTDKSSVTMSAITGIIELQPEGTTTLYKCVETALSDYLSKLDGDPVTEIYSTLLAEVEKPMLQQVLKYANYNQSKAAIMLGLNRGTLRSKLLAHGMTE